MRNVDDNCKNKTEGTVEREVKKKIVRRSLDNFSNLFKSGGNL